MRRPGKPRVVCILQMFGIGGMPKWLYQLAMALKDEFDFTFIATHSRYIVPEYRKVARVEFWPSNKWLLAVRLFLGRFDIAQVANVREYTDAARLARIPVVVERADGLRSGAALNSKDGLDAVIASTRGIVPYLEELIDPKKIHVIYNGVDLDVFHRSQPERFGFSPEDILIGRTSRLSRGKNISLLIRAVSELRRNPDYAHVRLVICGGDTTQPGAEPMMAELRRQAAELGKSVVFTGEIVDTTPVTLGYDIATCTSLPNNEGIPNSLLEAMAAGKPVVASAVDDVPELVEDGKTGLLFQSEDLSALISKLRDLVDNAKLRKSLGEAGRKRIDTEFNLKLQSRKYADLYRHLLVAQNEDR